MFTATLSYLKRIPGDTDLQCLYFPLLGSVKKEFENCESVPSKTKNHLRQINTDLEALVGVRTSAIKKQLMSVGEDNAVQKSTGE